MSNEVLWFDLEKPGPLTFSIKHSVGQHNSPCDWASRAVCFTLEAHVHTTHWPRRCAWLSRSPSRPAGRLAKLCCSCEAQLFCLHKSDSARPRREASVARATSRRTSFLWLLGFVVILMQWAWFKLKGGAENFRGTVSLCEPEHVCPWRGNYCESNLGKRKNLKERN